MVIYSLWVHGPLSKLNHLSIRSFREHGHKLIIYTFDQSIDAECEIRDANEILSKEKIFLYKHFSESYKFGGIAERLKAEMLYKLGGWHVDLDVVCLKPFVFANEYVLRPHPTGVVGNIIRAPQHSPLAEQYVNWTKKIDENNIEWEKSFLGLTDAVMNLHLQKYIVKNETFGTDDNAWWVPLLMNAGVLPHPDTYAIHFCGAMQLYNAYVEGSYYSYLLKKYGLS